MPDIGATLQEARMRARIDISEVEAATKIRAKYLRAIENEEWDMLPGPTFVKSFLRTYAEYLGIDGKLLVEEYKLRYEPPPSDTELQSLGPPVGPRRAPRPPRLSRGWILGLSILGLIILLVVLGSIGGGNDDAPVATRPATTPKKPAPKPKPAPTVARLTLIPTGEVYVCVRSVSDKLLVNETLTRRRSLTGKRFRVSVGNSSVEMRVNGRKLSVTPSPEPTTYVITPAGRRKVPETQNACSS
jgi:Helix-turn-helix domain